MFKGFYKCAFHVGESPGRSVMYVGGGEMLGGNSAFAHIGTYQEADGEIVADVGIHRHNPDLSYISLLGADDGTVQITASPQATNGISTAARGRCPERRSAR